MRALLRRVGRGWTAPADSDARLPRQSRWASVGLALVLLGVSGFVAWSSHATGAAATRSYAANIISDHYADAATAVSDEASWEREYRLAPRAEAEQGFDRASAVFVSAMREVSRDGAPADRRLAEGVLARHAEYLRAVEKIFRARDRGDLDKLAQIDQDEADPAFVVVEKTVRSAAGTAQQSSLAELDQLLSLQRLTRVMTPLVFIFGLVLAALLALVTRGYRRQLVQERAQAVHDALHDPLTGLPNRAMLNERLARMLRADTRASSRTGLLLIDLDRFKEINDTFGHQYGDAVLKQIGPRLAGALGEDDIVARLGGDEFAVLLADIASETAATAVAVKLRRALEPSFRIFGVELDVGASVGVVVSGDHGKSANTLLQRADIAMYAAKTQGVGVYSYAPDIDRHSPEKLALLGELRDAMSRHDLVVHYEPKIAVSSGELIGAEALVRWDHKSRGVILPGDFIPLAEHTELIGPLTRYVLDAALTQARTWVDEGRPLTVSVNLSARNLLDEHLPQLVADLLQKHAVGPELLVLEVTESALMADPVRAGLVLERLCAMKVRICIDDFGAGYTSLSQLKNLPVSELKIDKSFVMTMTEDPVNAVIVESVIDLGHNLGLTIVAEGIEGEHTLTALRRLGCDIGQGYHFSRAIPAHALDSWRVAREVSFAALPLGRHDRA